ncbi:hypothetical protein [Streptomyces chartreusis]|nr:hypothetical protein [Streptomyces chartreusis]WUB22939.1 hypothetical protein OG997_42310 [Streptomyces chartreusis]
MHERPLERVGHLTHIMPARQNPDSYLAGLHLRASMIWIKEITRTG